MNENKSSEVAPDTLSGTTPYQSTIEGGGTNQVAEEALPSDMRLESISLLDSPGGIDLAQGHIRTELVLLLLDRYRATGQDQFLLIARNLMKGGTRHAG